jgi:hypothetical protein
MLNSEENVKSSASGSNIEWKTPEILHLGHVRSGIFWIQTEKAEEFN